MQKRTLCVFAAILGVVSAKFPNKFPENTSPSLQWTGASFAWPCPSTKALYKSSGKYISKNIIATRAQITGDVVFLAMPRFRPGNPATLVQTSLTEGSCHTKHVPFPCWSMQEEGNCQALQSVVDVHMDMKDVLWTLDMGVTNTMENPVRRCPPKVVAFNSKTGKVLKIINLEELTTESSRLQYLVVDYDQDNRCFVYVSDAATRSILVFDVQASRGYRVIIPKAVTFGSAKRDVFYLTLIRKSCGSTVLYFTYLGSKRMFSLKTEYLRKGYAQGRVTDVGVKPNTIVIIGTDGVVIFFRLEGKPEVYRWDPNTSFKSENFRVVYRSQNCHLATHALADYKRGSMRVLESNFHDYMMNTVGCGAEQQLSTMTGCW